MKANDWGTVPKLKQFCRQHGLYLGGRKAELEARILGALVVGARMEVRDSSTSATGRLASITCVLLHKG